MAAAADQFAAAVASLIEKQPAVAQEFVDFGETCAQLFGFKLQQAFASLGGVAFGLKVGGVLRQLQVFGFALQFFRGGCLDLRAPVRERALPSPKRSIRCVAERRAAER